jgi:predicted AlkP superfamily pyrophosphatase or phosphodiesterase
VGSACSGEGDDTRVGPTLMQMARALGTDVMRSVVRGYVPGRSGDIALIPEPWNVLGNWQGGRAGVRDPRTTHATPWSYHQRVPITLYGPGYIRSGVVVERSVDMADLAPTYAELMDFEFEGADGRVLREALVPRSERPEPPRAIVTAVFDGGGWNVLQEWPDAWPVQRGLMSSGTTFTNATNGSAPSVTAPVHATLGTGVYPRRHGIAENASRLPDGTIGDIALERADFQLMTAETLADAWDRSTGNRAWVGVAGYESWHLAMMGRGAQAPAGGDADAAVLWDREETTFWTNTDAYVLPRYLPGRDVFEGRLSEIDAADGARDGRWGKSPLDPDTYQYTANPAFAWYSGQVILRMALQEPIGLDDITDLAFFEFKTGDLAGHFWGMESRQFETVWREQDRILGELVETLDRRIGEGRYVLAVTADHGQTPIAENYDGLRIDRFELAEDVEDRFGVVEVAQPSDLYVDLAALKEEGLTLEEIARWIGDYRYGEGLPTGFDVEDLTAEELDDRVFAAALPGPFLESLSEEEIDALGPGRYPEADLTSPPDVPI